MRSWALPSSAPLPPALILDPVEPLEAPARRGRAGRAVARAAHGLVPLDARSIRPRASARRCCGRSRSPRTGWRSPFRDAANWTHGLFNAKSENEKLRKRERRACSASCATLEGAEQENALLQKELHYAQGPTLPEGLRRGRRPGAHEPLDARPERDDLGRAATRGSRSRTSWSRTRASSARSRRCSANESRVTLITDPSEHRPRGRREEPAGGRHPRPRQRGDLARPRPRRQGQDASTSATRSSPRARRPAASSPSLYPRSIPIGFVSSVEPDRHRHLQADPGAAVRRPLVARVGARADPEGRGRASSDAPILDASRRSLLALRRGARPGLDASAPTRRSAARPTSCSSR